MVLSVVTSVTGISVALVVALCALTGRDWAPLIVIASVPIQRLVLVGASAHDLTYTQCCLGAFFAGAVVRFARRELSFRIDLPGVLFGLMPFAMAFSIIAGPDLHSWAGEVYRWATPVGFFVVARPYFSVWSRDHVLKTASAMLVGCGVWSCVQIVSDSGPTSFHRNGLLRVYGGFGEPNPFAACVVFLTLLLIGAVGLRQHTWLTVGGAIAGCGATIASQSRGGLVAFAVGLGVLLAMLVITLPLRLRVLMIGISTVTGGVAIAAIAQAIPWRLSGVEVTSGNWATMERAAHWQAAWAMLAEHPLRGVGAGGFSDVFRQYTTEWRFRVSRGHAHNAYLQVAAECGLPGLVVYLALLATICRRLFVGIIDPGAVAITRGVLAATCAMMVHQCFDYLNVLSLGLLFAGFWAAALSSSDEEITLRERYRYA